MANKDNFKIRNCVLGSTHNYGHMKINNKIKFKIVFVDKHQISVPTVVQNHYCRNATRTWSFLFVQLLARIERQATLNNVSINIELTTM